MSECSCRPSHWSTEAGRWVSLDYTHSSSLLQPCQCGGVEAQGHTRVTVVLRPARPRLVITLWSPGGSQTGRPHPCGGASGWTWPTLCGRCAPNKAPRQRLVPPKSVPGPAGRPPAGCSGQRSGGCLCCRVPRAHPRDPLTPQEAYAWSAECRDRCPSRGARPRRRPDRSGSADEGEGREKIKLINNIYIMRTVDNNTAA